jgi:hypothetical protein
MPLIELDAWLFLPLFQIKGKEKATLAVLQRMAVINEKALPEGRLVSSHSTDGSSSGRPKEAPVVDSPSSLEGGEAVIEPLMYVAFKALLFRNRQESDPSACVKKPRPARLKRRHQRKEAVGSS